MWYNPIIKLLLLSPLHGFASRDILLLEYIGRKSGKKYTVPLSYVKDEADYLMLSLRRRVWWRNMRSEMPVRMRVRGKWIEGVGQAVEERVTAAKDLGIYIQSQSYLAQHFDIRMEEGIPNPEDLFRETEKRLMVRVHTNPES